MKLGCSMKNSKEKEQWDGKSRISNNIYRKNFNEIFGQKEQEELNASYKQSLANKKEREKKINNENLNGENSDRFVNYDKKPKI